MELLAGITRRRLHAAQGTIGMQIGLRTYDLRLWDDKHGDFDIEAALTCNVVPGPPNAWKIQLNEQCESALQADDAGAWSLAAGAQGQFMLELVDAHGNQCVLQCYVHLNSL